MYHDIGDGEIYLINKENFMAFQFASSSRRSICANENRRRSEVVQARFDDVVLERLELDEVLRRVWIFAVPFDNLLAICHFLADADVSGEELLQIFTTFLAESKLRWLRLKPSNLAALLINFFCTVISRLGGETLNECQSRLSPSRLTTFRANRFFGIRNFSIDSSSSLPSSPGESSSTSRPINLL